MKIAITTVQAPFVSGGAELHAQNLKKALMNYGHESEIVTIPFMDTPINLIEDCIVASRLFDLSNSWAGKIDLCIGLKFPAYYIPHPNKVIWALHQHRAAYDLFNTEYSNLKNTPDGIKIRQIIKNADENYLLQARKIYANSNNVAKRMLKFNNINATPLYHPCPDMEKFYCNKYEDYILMPSRINITKRQHLAIEAMRYTKSKTKLYIVGKADNDYERLRMIDLIKKYGLEDKIKYFDYVEQEEKFKLYANAKAVLFIPLDEDYGYITLESMASSKAIITAKDSGGPLEFVDNDINGYVIEPQAQDLARKIDVLSLNNELSEKMGSMSLKKLNKMNITWESVVRELTKN